MGVRPTEIAQALDFKANTLSHHLADLAREGLIAPERRGRSIYYRVDLTMAQDLVDHLLGDCCRGRPDICSTSETSPRERFPADGPMNVLFVCSGNSARSIFAEALLRDAGEGRFCAFSAGTRPAETVNPKAIDVLNRHGHKTDNLYCKDIAAFERGDAPRFDFIFTVCDRAASEETVRWRDRPMTAHWGIPDPVLANGTDTEAASAFERAYLSLRDRIEAFAALPFSSTNQVELQKKLDRIGEGCLCHALR